MYFYLGLDWKSDAKLPETTTAASSPEINGGNIDDINNQIVQQGNLVTQVKAEKAGKVKNNTLHLGGETRDLNC